MIWKHATHEYEQWSFFIVWLPTPNIFKAQSTLIQYWSPICVENFCRTLCQTRYFQHMTEFLWPQRELRVRIIVASMRFEHLLSNQRISQLSPLLSNSWRRRTSLSFSVSHHPLIHVPSYLPFGKAWRRYPRDKLGSDDKWRSSLCVYSALRRDYDVHNRLVWALWPVRAVDEGDIISLPLFHTFISYCIHWGQYMR